MHSDRYLTPTARHIGTAAMEVTVVLRREDDQWRGAYAVHQGVGWMVEGKLAPLRPRPASDGEGQDTPSTDME